MIGKDTNDTNNFHTVLDIYSSYKFYFMTLSVANSNTLP